ncbi:MAG: SgcJ/EcaC family oxidoreductase [Planctomycetota bacterium]|nr:SgcJ/EcaC family oxidoreductase [Planctomycetota bacterium]
MIRRLFVVAVITAVQFSTLHFNIDGQARAEDALKGAAPTDPKNAAHEAVQAKLTKYAESFNAGDAEKLSQHWSESATHIDRTTGVKTEGRPAIAKMFAGMFETDRDAKLDLRLDSVRLITPDVASIEGFTRVQVAQQNTDSHFTAILVRAGDQWLVDSVQETMLPPPVTAAEHLQPLAWLVGDWRDDTPNADKRSLFRWSADHNFLIRTFQVAKKQGIYEGAQIIGWDPVKQQIRSWMFSSDGSFGEGVWTSGRGRWTVRYTGTLASGGKSSATQILIPKDDQSYTSETISHEINGTILPASGAVLVKREATPAANQSSYNKGSLRRNELSNGAAPQSSKTLRTITPKSEIK